MAFLPPRTPSRGSSIRREITARALSAQHRLHEIRGKGSGGDAAHSTQKNVSSETVNTHANCLSVLPNSPTDGGRENHHVRFSSLFARLEVKGYARAGVRRSVEQESNSQSKETGLAKQQHRGSASVATSPPSPPPTRVLDAIARG